VLPSIYTPVSHWYTSAVCAAKNICTSIALVHFCCLCCQEYIHQYRTGTLLLSVLPGKNYKIICIWYLYCGIHWYIVLFGTGISIRMRYVYTYNTPYHPTRSFALLYSHGGHRCGVSCCQVCTSNPSRVLLLVYIHTGSSSVHRHVVCCLSLYGEDASKAVRRIAKQLNLQTEGTCGYVEHRSTSTFQNRNRDRTKSGYYIFLRSYCSYNATEYSDPPPTPLGYTLRAGSKQWHQCWWRSRRWWWKWADGPEESAVPFGPGHPGTRAREAGHDEW
jgi:hypothetical protein